MNKIVKTISTISLIIAMSAMTACAPAKPEAPAAEKPAVEAPKAEDPKAEEPKKEEAPKAEAPAAGGVDLKMMWWGPDNRHKATLEAVELYKKNNPGINFTTEYVGWDPYWQKIPVLAASSTMPDILQMDAAFIKNYIDKGQLADLTDVDLTGVVDPKILEYTAVNGKIYGIPLGRNGSGYIYNKTDLEAAGIALPKEGWTMDDFFAFGEEARTKLPDGSYGIFDVSGMEGFNYYQASMGKGPLFDYETGKLNIDKETWLAFVNKCNDLRARKIMPSAEETASFIENDPIADPLATKKTMTRSATVGSVGALIDLIPDKELVVVNTPGGPNGAGWAQATIFFSVGENSAFKAEAKAFERWFVSDLEAGKILTTVRGIPISEEVYKSIESTLTPKDLLGKKLLDVATNNKPMPFNPTPPEYTSLVPEYKATMEALSFGSITVEQAYEQIMTAGNIQ